MPDLDARIERVRDELAALPGRPDVQDVFRRLDELENSALKPRDRTGPRNELLGRLGHYGVEHHRYRLEPPLSEEQVAAYERRNQIRLPEDYRAFITRVANGGAGPSFYRLLPLNPKAVDRRLHRPFPFRPDALPGRDWDVEQAFWEFDGSPFCPEPFWCGAIPLTDEGCTFHQMLVVTGPHRGRIVHIDLDRNDWPAFDPAPDFLTWYENWLFHRKDRLPWADHETLARIVLAGQGGAGAEDPVRACFHLVPDDSVVTPVPCVKIGGGRPPTSSLLGALSPSSSLTLGA